ncbi:MAG: dolichyl-phosphate beta-glucosyltransferase [Alectoria fallacina]|uniref:dolichyl-phosphate beta-glucosyltransferase n=1 Tax=Alectoria fallacina TaxID=1903189 RepID=A0A8H3I637_9LECA|nr:MAG: dolichyl-phosphate beta-glucosyltransferase [Alectoria fallacina]
MEYLREVLRTSQGVPLPLIVALVVSTIVGIAVLFYLALFIVAPIPRPPLRSEKTYRTIEPGEYSGEARPLPCWQDKYNALKEASRWREDSTDTELHVEDPEVFMSLVVPAFNEEERLGIMLTEAVEYLQHAYGNEASKSQANGNRAKRKDATREISNGYRESNNGRLPGWEILVVSDGSTDKTIDTALQFARDLGGKSASCIRVISLHENRGKGGAVTHGMRHVRGQYAIFADADGASKFEDLGKLVRASKKIEDAAGRGVAVGSRAHLVGSEAVVKRSFLRNLLMHSFHLLLRVLTPPATAAIRDTQCGFKLFSRPSLPHIIPYMHSEGWIFDVEMLMLAESAGIPVAESGHGLGIGYPEGSMGFRGLQAFKKLDKEKSIGKGYVKRDLEFGRRSAFMVM